MAIVGGFDLHRRQITFEYVDTASGEVSRGLRGFKTAVPPGNESFAGTNHGFETLQLDRRPFFIERG